MHKITAETIQMDSASAVEAARLNYPTRGRLAPRRLHSSATPSSANGANLHTYKPFESKDFIRLVSLHPGPLESPIKCDLINCNLKNSPDFEAVSYTWADETGDNSLSRHLLCGPKEQLIAITKSCEAALLRLRHRGESRLLWVDAVCIDQSCISERTTQVSLMSRIYHSASRVVVHLGGGSANSDEFMDFLNSWYPGNEHQDMESAIRKSPSVFSKSWFSRLWVLQEVTLARTATVVCGNKQAPWKKLALFHTDVLQKLYGHSPIKGIAPYIFEPGWPFTCPDPGLPLQYGLKGQMSIEQLPELLIAAQYQRASEPLDRIFALLGIVAKDVRGDLQPDYAKPLHIVFRELAIFFLRRFQPNMLFPRRLSSRRSTLKSSSSSHIPGIASWVFPWDGEESPGEPVHFTQGVFPSSLGLRFRAQRLLSGVFEIRIVCAGPVGGPILQTRHHVLDGIVKFDRSMQHLRGFRGEVEWDDRTLHASNVIVVKVSDDSGLALLKTKSSWKIIFGISEPSSPARSAYVVTPTKSDLFWEWSGTATWANAPGLSSPRVATSEWFDVV